jgi:hypothetical protein
MAVTRMNKKGMFFTLMTIAFLMVFIFIFISPIYSQLNERMVRIENRVLSMNNFVNDVERDAERGLYIASFRALLAMQTHIIDTGLYLSDTESAFAEAVQNGNINGTSYAILDQSTFPDWLQRITTEATQFNIGVGSVIHNISIVQTTPWTVDAIANITLVVTDDGGATAQWTRTVEIVSSISITGFEDPLMTIGSLGRVANVINKTPHEGNYSDGSIVTPIIHHAQQMYFATNADAPSFLMRFEGNIFENSTMGIESIVNLKELEDAGLSVDATASVIDHQYWNATKVKGTHIINDTPSWIRMDLDHVYRYNLTDVAMTG